MTIRSQEMGLKGISGMQISASKRKGGRGIHVLVLSQGIGVVVAAKIKSGNVCSKLFSHSRPNKIDLKLGQYFSEEICIKEEGEEGSMC